MTRFSAQLAAVLALVLATAAVGVPGAFANGAVANGQVYSLSDLSVLQKVAPRYPSAAARGGFEGWVELEFTVTQDGGVSDVEVKDSSSRIFHREALAAISSWRFEPVQNGGRPVPVRATMRFTFRAE